MFLQIRNSNRIFKNNYYIRSYSILSSKIIRTLPTKYVFHCDEKSKPKFSFRHSSSLESYRNSYVNLFKSITESDIVDSVKESLIVIHNFSGLSWGVTIIGTTVVLRAFVTFPLCVYQSYVLARLELVKEEFASIVQELKKETAIAIKRFEWTDKQARLAYNASLKTQWRLLVERDNCHPLKTTLVIWVQLPMWILLSLALRCMAYKYGQDPLAAELVANQLSEEGIAWISNLLQPDSTGILPCAVTLTNLAIIELMACSKPKHTRLQRVLTNVFRGLALVSLPIAYTVPSCMSLYWCVSSLLALCQNVILMSPRVRRNFGIPLTPSHKEHPYRNAWSNFKSKLPFQGS